MWDRGCPLDLLQFHDPYRIFNVTFFFSDDLSQIALSMTSAMRQRYLRKYMRMTLFRFPLDLLQLRDPYRILNVTFFLPDDLSQIALSVTSLREKKREQREKDRREDSKRRENNNNNNNNNNRREKERACV